MAFRNQLSRRTVLKGLGASLSLPLLDAMQPTVAVGAGNALKETASPQRMAFMFVPNGAHLPLWTPQRSGYDYDLPTILEPLARVQDDLTVLTGLTHDKGRANGDGPGDHARSASVFLTGAQPHKTAGADFRVGVSVDQVAASHLGKTTRFPSLELGCDAARTTGSCDSGYACAYSHHISWASANSPVAKEINPRLVFERLFGGDNQTDNDKARAKRDFFQKSLLDFVAEDAKQLHSRLGRDDQHKLDEYLAGVRAIERRLEQTNRKSPESVDIDGMPLPAGIPDDYAEHLRLMGDMMVLAFQSDLTRVCTFMFGRAGSNRSYREIEVPDGHHNLSHHGNDPVKLDKISRINRYHVQQFAYILERLKAIPEGDGTLLDNCMILYGSGLSDGNRHNNENLPVLLAGQGGGQIRSGRHVVYEEETPMTNLFLSMLDRVGVSIDYLGDSTGRLPYLG